jgi:xylose isomerase
MIQDAAKATMNLSILGPLAARHTGAGYRQELADESAMERLERAMAAFGELIDGYEFYYPHALCEENFDDVIATLAGTADVYAVAISHHLDPTFSGGALTAPDKSVRASAISMIERGAQLAGRAGARVMLWPGTEGYDYPFQISYRRAWGWLIDGLAAAAEHCRASGAALLIEYKPALPPGHILVDSLGTTLHIIMKLRDLGFYNVKVALDFQHSLLAGENLAESVARACAEDALGHIHANSSAPVGDAKRVLGATNFIEILEVATELREQRYAAGGGRIGFDLAAEMEDPSAAVRASIAHWRYFERLAAALDHDELQAARDAKDAITALEVVYRALDMQRQPAAGASTTNTGGS